MYDKQALIQLVRDKALRFGQFTLASGKQASYYLDGKQVTLDSVGARLIAAGILERLGQPLPQAVGGMAIGADPITAAVITLAGVQNLPLKGFLVRKEAKGHGTNRFVEGPVQAERRSGDRRRRGHDRRLVAGSDRARGKSRPAGAQGDRDRRPHGRGRRRPSPRGATSWKAC